ncbi:response regulator transcription factor [Changchengzhania lutea]|uniref:response regulator transcription factor n=1 Tax=Changchengzhania lutea TaxID=2049305 RepID=UPI00115C86CA|nr:helix-turn-helix transcriptional regulator [Changchengzhania lutea]
MKGKITSKALESKKDMIEFDVFNSITRLLNFPTPSKQRQIIHKINRILIEIEFIKKNKQKFSHLTQREKEIVGLLIKGNNNPQIAEHLFISRYTVEQHRKNINRKLEIHSVGQLYPFAYAFNLI